MIKLIACSIFLLAAVCFAAMAKNKWTILFDGKTTDAFRAFKRDSFPEKGWAVENGALKTIVGGDRVDLITKDKYQNFELELEWRVSPGGNSGVIYLVTEDESETYRTGPEMQVLDDERHRDGKSPLTSAGSLYALIAPAVKTVKPAGEWNRARLTIRDGHVEHWLGGKRIVEYDLGSDSLKEKIAQSKFKEFPRFAQNREGHIALQHHGEEVWYRNIRVRRLP
jgi:3-keto-disaccharide hydrolase